ncbi:AraC family transcriptional regulator [Prolixibacteraceae bacterium JC049]|jgi:AraC-like DNA-binding protein|nr:AraC family transcriptional regulator [Prolixibacteraceae bacterium JC049]
MILENTYRPGYPLNQFVDFIWIGKASKLEMKASHHAALFTELIFNYGDNFNVTGQNIESLVNRNDHHIISGLKTAPFQTEISGVYGSVGLILKPFCYGMLIDKFGTHAMESISEILYESFYTNEQQDFSKVEQQLLQLFGQPHIDSDLIQFENYLSSTLLEKGALQDFNLSISISQKSFIQKFKKHYLLTPNEYIKLKKVNSAIELLQNNNSKKLVEIGLESGFYDQSHFIRLFKKFCGVTPKEFIKYPER